MKCNSCPRKCGADRENGEEMGFCKSGALPKVAKAQIHMWEEPCISGERGSGTVFFSGCTLNCVYCQNFEISYEGHGREISIKRLGEIFDKLYEMGAHNINLVNCSHYSKSIYKLFESGYEKRIPFVYNSSGYESIETLKLLEDIIDVYLPDFKYYSSELSEKYSGVFDYYDIALKAIYEMIRQKGHLKLDESGIALEGVLIRHLILPGNTDDSIKIIDCVEKYFSNKVYMSLMSQYIPTGKASNFHEINRKLTTYEYKKVCNYAEHKNFENVYIQKRSSASESYIPKFDLDGI